MRGCPWILFLACAAVALAAAGCTSVVRSPLEHEITKHVTPDKLEFHVDGWSDHTGAHHKLVSREDRDAAPQPVALFYLLLIIAYGSEDPS